MIRRQFHSMLIWAAGSFGVVLALGLSLTTDAVDQPRATPLVQIIRTPGLTENGIELTVEPVGPTTRESVQMAGHPLTLLVRARNGSNAGATADFTLQLTSVAVRNARARTMPIPEEIWANSGSVTLNPGETKTLHFTTTPLPLRQMIDLNLSASQTKITALSFSSEALLASTTRPTEALQ